MAERRMFAKTIIDSDAFLEMPSSAQALYFHLSMRADDDGFVNNPKKITRYVNASADDLKLLVAKSFLIPFESGIVVIKHWRIHNYIQSDRYKPTVYVEEKALLSQKENKAYTLDTECIHDVYSLEAQDRIGKNSIDKINNISSNKLLDCPTKSDEKYVFPDETKKWNELETLGITPIRGITPDSTRAKLLKARLKQYGKESFDEVIKQIRASDFLQGKHNGRPWQITFDWLVKPNNYPKVLEGNYKNAGAHTGSAFDNITL